VLKALEVIFTSANDLEANPRTLSDSARLGEITQFQFKQSALLRRIGGLRDVFEEAADGVQSFVDEALAIDPYALTGIPNPALSDTEGAISDSPSYRRGWRSAQ
jgi:hypothetical protein